MSGLSSNDVLHELVCVAHVHSTFSDGTATVPEIVAAAREAQADALLLTDHDSLEAARQGLEGWHEGVLLLVGHEITTRRGHLLAFGLEQEVAHRGLSEAEICAVVRQRGGIAFAAHPFSRGGAIKAIIRPHPWGALEECPELGIEVWSLLTDTAEAWRNPVSALRFLAGPERGLDGPRPENLARWDELSLRRRVPAIGGLDAHQTGLRLGDRVLSPMPNARYFKLLRTHVLLARAPEHVLQSDRAAVYDSLRQGRAFLAADAIAPAHGFRFRARTSAGRIVSMGGEVRAGELAFEVLSPRPAELTLLRDGSPVAHEQGDALEHHTSLPGVYRVQARLDAFGRRRVWIVSNPVYVRGSTGPANREESQ